VRTALTMKTDRTNADPAIGAKHLAGSHRAPNEHGRRCLTEKLSSSDLHDVMWVTSSVDSGGGWQEFQGSS